MRRRAADACWAAAEPARGKLHASYMRWTKWWRRCGDTVWAAGDARRQSWRQATRPRRALVVTLAALPFVMAMPLSASLLSEAGGQSETSPAEVKAPAEPAEARSEAKSTAAVERSRDDDPGPASPGGGSAGPGADLGAAAAPSGTRLPEPERLGEPGSDLPARHVVPSPGADRRSGGPPVPKRPTPDRKAPAEDDSTPVSTPDSPPTTPAPPPADAPDASPPPTEQTLHDLVPDVDVDVDVEVDVDTEPDEDTGDSERRGPPRGRGGGGDHRD